MYKNFNFSQPIANKLINFSKLKIFQNKTLEIFWKKIKLIQEFKKGKEFKIKKLNYKRYGSK
ncbi:MAG: hypothetical protein Fur0024_4490 [Patescibacteria group bacterium]